MSIKISLQPFQLNYESICKLQKEIILISIKKENLSAECRGITRTSLLGGNIYIYISDWIFKNVPQDIG